MTITLPSELESLVQAVVHSGQFASVDDAMTEAVRLLVDELELRKQPPANDVADAGLGSIGAMRDDADLLDQAVEHAMKVREERPWRLSALE
jgi:Arc/MetJ-type ribon-helix-helix transcriptional regulator